MVRHGERIVCVDFPDVQGSGYLVTPRHVLTVSHLATDAVRLGETCDITFMPLENVRPGSLVVAGTVAWVDEKLDIAVVRLREPVACEGDGLRFGALSEIRKVAFSCCGFPRGARSHMKYVHGELSFIPTGGHFDLDYASSQFLDVQDWAGISGAMVFHGDCAVAVVRTVATNLDRKLTATPLKRLVDDGAFQAFWQSEAERHFELVDLGTGWAAAAAPPREPDYPALVSWCDRADEFRALSRLAGRGCTTPRMLGLAGHVSHHAEEVLDRLVAELRETEGNIGHYMLRQYHRFASVEDLAFGIGAELAIGLRGDPVGLDAEFASRNRLNAAIIAIPIECGGLRAPALWQRLAILGRWLDGVRGFPCPVVVVLLLRWDATPPAGWLATLLRRRPDPEQEIRKAWQRYERGHASAPAGEPTLYALLGYEREDVRCWLRHRQVAGFFTHRSFLVQSRLESWFGDRTHLTFRELATHVATL